MIEQEHIHIEQLPNELLYSIFTFSQTNTTELTRITSVCKRWRDIGCYDTLWSNPKYSGIECSHNSFLLQIRNNGIKRQSILNNIELKYNKNKFLFEGRKVWKRTNSYWEFVFRSYVMAMLMGILLFVIWFPLYLDGIVSDNLEWPYFIFKLLIVTPFLIMISTIIMRQFELIYCSAKYQFCATFSEIISSSIDLYVNNQIVLVSGVIPIIGCIIFRKNISLDTTTSYSRLFSLYYIYAIVSAVSVPVLLRTEFYTSIQLIDYWNILVLMKVLFAVQSFLIGLRLDNYIYSNILPSIPCYLLICVYLNMIFRVQYRIAIVFLVIMNTLILLLCLRILDLITIGYTLIFIPLYLSTIPLYCIFCKTGRGLAVFKKQSRDYYEF
jgi:hypothetical protein